MREVNVGHKSLADYRTHRPHASSWPRSTSSPRACAASACCTSTPPPSAAAWPRSSTRWCRSRRRRPRGRVAGPHRAARVLQRHQGLPQRPAGARRRRSPPRCARSTRRVCRANAEAAHAALRLRRRPRPAAAGHARLRPLAGRRRRRTGSGAATSTPRRPTGRCTTTSLPFDRPLRRAPSTRCASTCPPGLTVPVREIAPDHRPAGAQEHGALAPRTPRYIVRQFGIDVERPLLLQVSRFDPWKDPLGVVDVYRTVKAKHPDVQLALVGSMASDDPEGWDYLEKVIDYVGDDPDVFILSNLDNVGSVEINAFQSHADVVMQKSTREGFGLTVTEALWKGAADHRRRRRRHPAADRGRRHRLPGRARSPSAPRAASTCSPTRAAPAMALRGKEHVRRDFLTPRLLRDDLRLFTDLLDGKIGERRPGPRPRPGEGGQGVQQNRSGRAAAGRGRQPRPGLVPQRPLRRAGGHARPRRPRHRAHRGAAQAPRHLGGGGARRRGGAPRRRRAAPSRSTLDGDAYRVRYVAVEPDVYHQYYNIVANPMLWFIQHYLWDLGGTPTSARTRPTPGGTATCRSTALRRGVVDEARRRRRGALVMLHDYHLYGVAPHVRAARPAPSCSSSCTSPGRSPTPGACCRSDMRAPSSRACSPTTSSPSTPALRAQLPAGLRRPARPATST